MTPPPPAPADLCSQWLTISELATEYNRSERQIRNWCHDGTLHEFGFRVMRVGHAWWIASPSPVVSRK